jgi:DNA invertase Pin-like site-specific DNA recombinase
MPARGTLLLSGNWIVWRVPSDNSSRLPFCSTSAELHSLTENINTTTPSGKLTFHMFAALAEFERDILRQRVNAGLNAARRRGRIGGRPKALGEAELKKARALLRSGDYTKVQVAKELEVSRHTLWHALSQESAK